MSHLNPKTQLQEWCQKHHLPVPKYTTIQLKRAPCVFRSSLELWSDQFGKLVVSGDEAPRKVQAEQSAAQKAWEQMALSSRRGAVLQEAIVHCKNLLMSGDFGNPLEDAHKIQDFVGMPYRKQVIVAAQKLLEDEQKMR